MLSLQEQKDSYLRENFQKDSIQICSEELQDVVQDLPDNSFEGMAVQSLNLIYDLTPLTAETNEMTPAL